ncbi:hypothetical protein [uncultured Eubacterium sp.]|jgi:hypothetical protein|uniref:hypothetical protein n=1 Tax=uncultured Eubacterium sp. TaxID=165185 RepID=UPI00259A48D1|nr:hypothetical protein [uncultured Eubacterium sp.]
MDNKQAIENLKDFKKWIYIGDRKYMEALDKAIASLEKMDKIESEVNWLCDVKKTEFNYKIAFDSIKKIIWDWSD